MGSKQKGNVICILETAWEKDDMRLNPSNLPERLLKLLLSKRRKKDWLRDTKQSFTTKIVCAAITTRYEEQRERHHSKEIVF